ncbi:hypothetical protein [Laspinema olomoucense]|uniref:hypothetical protein n=1 Tax=Laspinema olomoucense TaxID=3231600 RepID=UPI0021BAEEE8|nr:hypothetical protein [Laspinema sp. D3d]MCT7973412.1 hypothetical protein [Laspinema sp. D3d]
MPILRGDRLTATQSLPRLNHKHHWPGPKTEWSYLQWKRMTSAFEAIGQQAPN